MNELNRLQVKRILPQPELDSITSRDLALIQDNKSNSSIIDEVSLEEDDNATVSKLIFNINLLSHQNRIGEANITFLNSERKSELQDDACISK